MSQRQFTTYQSDVLSFELREAMLGILNPGRYSGYLVMASNGTPSGGSIPIKLQHTGGVQKLPKGGSSLDPAIGVVVTTQGGIIHEDQEVTLSVTDNSGGGDVKYSLIYLEHTYQDGVEGDNPAIYGVINGTAGGGVPALTSAYKRCIIGVVEMPAGATAFAQLIWDPRPSDNVLGDSKVLQILFGVVANYQKSKLNTIPADGIIGTRIYTEENYITNEESITSALDDLDMSLWDIETTMTAIGNRAIDDVNWGALTDNTRFNVSTSAHGFAPKLPNDATKYLNGVGAWAAMKQWVWRTELGTDLGKSDFGNFAASSGTVDLTAMVPSDCDLIFIKVKSVKSTYVTNSWVGLKPYNVNCSYLEHNHPVELTTHYVSDMMLKLDSTTKKFDWVQIGAADFSAFEITIFAYLTAT